MPRYFKRLGSLSLCVIIALWAMMVLRSKDVQRVHPSGPRPETPVAAADPATPPVAPSIQPAAPVRATNSLARLRRAFHVEPVIVGTPTPGRAPLELEGWRIHAASLPRLTVADTAPGETAAYFVQFAGPIEPVWRKHAEQRGAIHGYLPHHTFAMDLSASAAKHLAREPFVSWIHPVLPEYKVQPFLRYLASLDDNAGLPDTIPVTISTLAPSDAQPVAEALANLSIPATEVQAGKRWGWVRAEVPLDRLSDIAALPRVQWIEEYVAPALANDQAVIDRHMNVTNVWFAHGLTGRGQIIGHADSGLDLGSMALLHPDLKTNLLVAFDRGRAGRWDDPNGHGTHTAGSILGSGVMSTGIFRGVAWEAQLVHQSLLDSGGGLGGLPGDLNQLYLQAYTNGARVHSDSWGAGVFGAYTTSSRQSDEFMWDHPDMLLVFSAGNEGIDGNADGVVDADSIGSPATAKNLLTVGAAESDRAPGSGGFTSFTYGDLWFFDYPADPIYNDYVSQSSSGTNQGLAAFSSRGPTDDGRVKPDVVAPGTDVVSTRSRAVGANGGWGIHPNNNYNFNGGTSMSTPLVAGAAALVRQYFQEYRGHATPSAALLKAALIHGARPMAPGQYGAGAQQEVPDASPNQAAGWGHVDLGNTLFPDDIAWFFADQTNGLAAPGEWIDHVFFADTGTVRITLAYTDYPSTAGGGQKLVNDLDLSLFAPDGSEHAPAAGPDRTNNIEQLIFSVASSGIHTARVAAFNIPSGPQPYALVVCGTVADAPMITHTPLPNSFETNTPYLVEADVFTSGAADPDLAAIFWRVAGDTNDFSRAPMLNNTNHCYTGTIPAQPLGTMIEYYLEATTAVFTVRHPAAAPVDTHAFLVAEPITLTVAGFPADIFSVDPPYGVHTYASGNVVRLTAPAHTNTAPGIRIAITGFSGDGSVPTTGETNAIEVVLESDSSITWQWINQHALTQSSSPSGSVSETSWWNAWSFATTAVAAVETTIGGTNLGLAGWLVDGQRWPNNTAPAQNPAIGIVMYSPRSAVAQYLPATQDANGNGLPDWWEQFYFGTNAASSGADADNDGFTNGKEYQDRTNPRDPLSIPEAPAIAHIPLNDPQATPAPWNIAAVITDNFGVSNAWVAWQINGGAWTTGVLSRADSNFTGAIAGPATNGNAVVYRIEAVDFAGLKSAAGPYPLSIAYPLLRVDPADTGEIGMPADSITNIALAVSNDGLAPLSWTAQLATFFADIEAGTGTWTHAGASDVWHVTTTRHHSAHSSWHFGGGPFGHYPDNANAWLASEPVTLAQSARLTFRHWARMEYDSDQVDDHYWDGGVVELSTNGGVDFFMIEPVGGYPHRITDNPASPFAPETPCYGATEGWEEAAFDLSSFAGETVIVRFRFGSDGFVTEQGWYIDDIGIDTTNDAAWAWIDPDDAGNVAAGGSSNLLLTLDTATVELAGRRRAVVVVRGETPVFPQVVAVPVGLHNITREITVTSEGPGIVDPSGPVRVLLGQATNFWLVADPYHEASRVYTNGEAISDYIPAGVTNIAWPVVESNGTLHVVFTERIIDDRVPEWWLVAQGFTNDVPEIEAATDHDGDGMVAWQEYVAETDPHDPESVALILLAVRPDDASDAIEWTSFTNLTFAYELHLSTNPPDGFIAIATNLPATPPVNIFTNLVSDAPARIYRVLLLAPDEP